MGKTSTNNTKIKQKIDSLERQSELLRDEIEHDLVVTKERVSDLGKIALGIGGGIIFSAIVLRGLIGKKGKDSKSGYKRSSKKVYQRFFDQLFSELSHQGTNLLLGIVKDKLTSITDNNEHKKDDDSDITG